MKMKKLMYAAAALLMVAACNSNKTSQVVAELGEDAPQKVKISVGGQESVIGVKDGKLEAKLPVDVLSVSHARIGASKYTFISDGSKLTLDPNTGKVVSNKKDGVHSRYEAYNAWKKAFMDEYYAKMEQMEDGSEEARSFFNENRDKYNAYLIKTLKANKNNYLGALAASDLALEDPDQILSQIKHLSSKVQALPIVVETKKACEEVKARNQ